MHDADADAQDDHRRSDQRAIFLRPGVALDPECLGGGQIVGPGTGTSDSVHALLSNGEFVVKESSARTVGYGFLHALNSMPSAFAAIGSAVRMAMGGIVGAPQRFAGGGMVAATTGGLGGHSVVNLTIGGGTFSLFGEKGVVQALTGAARKAAIMQTGRSPSWRK